MNENADFTEVLDLASKAGHILLQNGAEISRVEDIMSRISSHFGVDSGNFFVLSNGIFTTGLSSKMRKSSRPSSYANVEFIPIKGSRLDKVVAVNDLSYDIAAGRYSPAEARKELERIEAMEAKPLWEQVLGAGLGAGGFCAVFGGGWLDCLAAFTVGVLAQFFIMGIHPWQMTKIVGGIANALVTTLLCLLCYRIGFGHSLGNIIIGAVMPLVPGVPFVNGVRDLANSDYIAGITRLTDAMICFLCIAVGVIVTFFLDGWIHSGIVVLEGMKTSPQTYGFLVQGCGAFLGTLGFAILYSFPRKLYATAGFIGAMGWIVYLILLRFAEATPVLSALAGAIAIGILSRIAAVLHKCPGTVFLLSGNFPLVPGAGLFWCTYYIVSNQVDLGIQAGFSAIKTALAIVMGIILAMELPQSLFSGKRRHCSPETKTEKQ